MSVFDKFCNKCYSLNRPHGKCDRYGTNLNPVTIGSTIKWIKCEACVEAAAKKEKDE